MQFYCSNTNHYRAHTGAANLVQRIRPKLWQRGYGFDGPRAPPQRTLRGSDRPASL
jgi:hypothetical protein